MTALNDKIALVTGASRGIGRAIAIALSNEGAKVIVNFQNDEASARETVRLMSDPKKALIMRFDVSNESAVENAVDAIKNELGSIDILVNNAGITADGLLLRLKNHDFDRQINVNLRGAFNCAKACTRHMIKTRFGRIINISSVVAEMGNPGQSVYAACKAGLIGMTKSLAKELASRNILVNAVTPGYIETDMTKEILMGKESLLDFIPLKRVGTPEDVANVVTFLASDKANYITGQVLAVNGGLYM